MVLENKNIRIICLDKHGGKLSSIYDKKNDFELLFQNPKPRYKKAKVGDDFSEFEACGFDDAFPSITKEKIEYKNKLFSLPDHGEVWSSKMQIIDYSSTHISLFFEGKVFPYSYKKQYTLKNNGVKVSYIIINNADFDVPCFYTFHCLVNCTKNCQLILPENIDEVFFVDKSIRFKDSESIVSYPISENGNDLSYPSLLAKGQSEKFYITSKIKHGEIGYNFQEKQLKVIISYDSNSLPYLGFWNTQGGFRDDYNIALEMSNGFYDSISKALENKACPIFKPNEKMEFSFDIDFEYYISII